MIEHDCLNGLYLRRRSVAGSPHLLLYVHGLGESGLGFEPTLLHPGLGEWSQLVLDLPGYGKTPWIDPPMSLDGLAERLAEWLDEGAERPVVVVGHSMGGVVGQLLCESAPAHVAGFVNVEGNISPGDCVYSGKAASRSEETFVGEGFEHLLDEVYRAGVGSESLRRYYASMRMCNPRAFHLNSIELVEASGGEDLGRRLGDLTMPRIYIFGRSNGAPERSVELVQESGVDAHGIDRAGHWPFLDRPADFVGLLRSFLHQLPA